MDSNHLSLLQAWLKKEVDAMREILANMHLEEICLLKKDTDAWHQVLKERSYLYLALSDAREQRMQATAKAFPQLKKEELSFVAAADNCEILLLADQLISLVEKLNSQSSRNELLSQIAKNAPVLQKASCDTKKKILRIATMPPEEIS